MKLVIANIREYLLVIGVHFALLISVYLLLYVVGEFKVLPTDDNLYQFDANWYGWISRHGYQLRPDGSSPTAFFPLFPLWMRYFSFNSIGVISFNALLFLTGMWLMVKNFGLSRGQLLLYLSLPSTLFFYLPYTESTFFLSSVIFLIGLKKEHKLLTISGLFLAALTRPSVLFFIPALIVVGIIQIEKLENKFQIPANLNLFILGLGAIFGGLIVVNAIQYADTQTYFAFWTTQSEQWGNHLQMPEFPLRTWSGSRLMWLDGMAFSCAIAALLFCIKIGWEWLQRVLLKPKQVAILNTKKTLPSTQVFAVVYLAIIGLFTLLYHEKDPLGGTTLMGINRYFFATAFFVLLWRKVVTLERNDFVEKRYNYLIISVFGWMMLLTLGAFAPSNFPNHLRTVLYFLFIFIFLKWQHLRGMGAAFYVIHLALQLVFLHGWLQGKWLG